MPFFIKTETIKEVYLTRNTKERKEAIQAHKKWIKSLKTKGLKIESGFLINENKEPGGGGILIIECNSYNDALNIIIKDPMIKKEIVDWKFYEWININS